VKVVDLASSLKTAPNSYLKTSLWKLCILFADSTWSEVEWCEKCLYSSLGGSQIIALSYMESMTILSLLIFPMNVHNDLIYSFHFYYHYGWQVLTKSSVKQSTIHSFTSFFYFHFLTLFPVIVISFSKGRVSADDTVNYSW